MPQRVRPTLCGAFGAGRVLGEDVIIATSGSDEEAKGLLGQWKLPAFGSRQAGLKPS
jgi:hypothetical protein